MSSLQQFFRRSRLRNTVTPLMEKVRKRKADGGTHILVPIGTIEYLHYELGELADAMKKDDDAQ